MEVLLSCWIKQHLMFYQLQFQVAGDNFRRGSRGGGGRGARLPLFAPNSFKKTLKFFFCLI